MTLPTGAMGQGIGLGSNAVAGYHDYSPDAIPDFVSEFGGAAGAHLIGEVKVYNPIVKVATLLRRGACYAFGATEAPLRVKILGERVNRGVDRWCVRALPGYRQGGAGRELSAILAAEKRKANIFETILYRVRGRREANDREIAVTARQFKERADPARRIDRNSRANQKFVGRARGLVKTEKKLRGRDLALRMAALHDQGGIKRQHARR